MPDWTNATASVGGVLRPDEFARHVHLERAPAGERVAPWVENRWGLRWDLPEGRWFSSEVIPHPTAPLTLEHLSHGREGLPPGETLVVTGVCTTRFVVPIRGSGTVHGLRFRPGGLTALTGRPATAWVDRSVPAADVLPDDVATMLTADRFADDVAAWWEAAEDALAGLGSAGGRDGPDGRHERYEDLVTVVADMLGDHSLVTVAEVARRHATTPRTLQRLFEHHVGVGPKWVLARYRMHDVVAELDSGYDGSMADLAHRHGWYDQAHFTRDFTALVGVPPGRYRAGG